MKSKIFIQTTIMREKERKKKFVIITLRKYTVNVHVSVRTINLQ